jgi:S1-C subfamily serine protease
VTINRASAQSLFIIATSNDKELGTATGFVVEHDDKPYLITNWHVAAGRSPIDGQPRHYSGATPDKLVVLHLLPQTDPNRLEWNGYQEPLIAEDGAPLWLEHPELRRRMDVVALPLTNYAGTQLLPHDMNSQDDPNTALAAQVADWVNIIGFPFGRASAGFLGIWTKGAIASDPDLNFEDLPCFLIDARTREGQSGSPVISYASGGAIAMASGNVTVGAGQIVNLLGVYSGRINKESDLGMVWKVSALKEILQNGARGNGNLNP